MTRTALLRRLARQLTRHAANMLPESRAEWSQAMKNELEHIEGDLDALRWATGCVLASYRGGIKTMAEKNGSFAAIVRKPSAFLPMAMSLIALGVIGVAYVVAIKSGHGGLTREPDEGTAAHLWQLLMAGQLPLLAYFAIKWLPRSPKQALYVLGIQVLAVAAAMAPVYFLHL